MPKSIPISLRISEEDSAFLSELKLSGAVTPSEKIRKLIQEARTYNESSNASARLISQTQTYLQELQKQLVQAERREKVHSELVRFTLDWHNQFAQTVVIEELNEATSKAELEELENALVAQIFRMVDYIARLGLTPVAPCYVPGIVRERLRENIDLLHLVETQMTKGKKNG